MSCPTCERFPSPTSKFEELGVSIVRHGTLYRCKMCGGFFELIEEERGVRFLERSEADIRYPGIVAYEHGA